MKLHKKLTKFERNLGKTHQKILVIRKTKLVGKNSSVKIGLEELVRKNLVGKPLWKKVVRKNLSKIHVGKNCRKKISLEKNLSEKVDGKHHISG